MNNIKRQYNFSPATNMFWRDHRVNGLMILPLDNYLMMLIKAFPTYPADYLHLTNLRVHQPIIAHDDEQRVCLQLHCNEQGQCSISLVQQDNSLEVVFTCQFYFADQSLTPSLTPDLTQPMRPGDFSRSGKHYLGKSYHLATEFSLRQNQINFRISPQANTTAIIASLLHAPMYCQDENIAAKSRPSLPEQISRISLKIKEIGKAKSLCANESSACLFDSHGYCIGQLIGFNPKLEAKQTSKDVAVIGMAGLFPQSSNLETFWENLCQGINAIQPLTQRGEVTFKETRHAGWLADIFDFDNAYFRISEAEARAMDPQQRLFLSVVDDCLSDANYNQDRLATESCGVYVGASQSSYWQQGGEEAIAQSFWGNAPSVIAGRVSYHYDLHGPAMVFDTACSSSLVALHHAVKSIADGTCSLALAGGVFLMLDDSFIHAASKASMLSPDHTCQTFSDKANGFVPGEAVACVLLKPFEKAKADGDKIYACIKASGINQDGLSNGITAPNGDAQSQLLKQVYQQAAINLQELAVIEAHGTGTKLGDPIEVHALTKAVTEANLSPASVYIGSVKSNIGHTIHAAGIVSFIKMVMAAFTHQIPATLHCDSLNQHIDFTNNPFIPINKVSPWPARKPFAGISSFGFSGTNVHVLIEQIHQQPQVFKQTPTKQINKKTLYWQRGLTWVLDNKASYFAEHQVNGQPILPAVASLALAQQTVGEIPCTLTKISWLQALIQSSEATQPIRLIENGEQIILQSPQGRFFQAYLDKNLSSLPDLAHYPKSHVEQKVSISDFYAQFAQIGIIYGKQLQNITQLSYNEQFAVAEIKTEEVVEAWEYNPHLLDCALQTVACFTLLQSDELSVPTHAAKVSFYKPLKAGTAWAVSHYRDTHLFDIAVFNNDKQLGLFIEGLQATVINKTSSTQNLITKTSSMSILSIVYEVFAKRLGATPNDLKAVSSFAELGMDSLLSLDIILDLEDHFGSLPKTLLIDNTSFDELINFLKTTVVSHHSLPNEQFSKLEESVLHAEDDENSSIAIIGIAVNLPYAQNLEELTHVLTSGKDCITFDPNWHYPFAARLANANDFDALFFNIAPTDALIMSPQERLMLQNAWHCFENAGIRIDGHAKSVAVLIGAMNNEYQLNGFEQSLQQQQPVLANATSASIANRISSVFNLTGASICLDTMCSSSLTAVDLACKMLRQSQVEMALVGGVNLITHDYKYQELLHRNMLSEAGRCASFGEQADGYVPSEGVVSLLLKPLSQAKRDNNRIYAVIKGTSTNHNGRTSGYTVPHSSTQAQVIKDALNDAKLKASQLSYVECHGTGTKLGDPIEINGLKQVFTNKSTLHLGSIKSNYGHLEAAAGLAGIVKVVLQMHTKQLFPSLHSQQLNPEIHLQEGMAINQTTKTWSQARDGDVYAGVSSFGAGGSNAHVVLQSYHQPSIGHVPPGPYLFVFSAKDKAALNRNLKAIQQWLLSEKEQHAYQIGYTLAFARTHFKERAAFIASDLKQLREEISSFLTNQRQVLPASLLNDLCQAFLEGDKPVDFSHLYSQIVPISIDLPGYQFEAKTYQLRQAKPKDNELIYTTYDFEESSISVGDLPMRSFLVLACPSQEARCLSWGISPESIFLWQEQNCWRNYQGKLLTTTELFFDKVDYVLDMLANACSLQAHLALLEQLIGTIKVKKLIQLIELQPKVESKVISYYLHCQSQLSYGFKALTIEHDAKSDINCSILAGEIYNLKDFCYIRYESGQRSIKAMRPLNNIATANFTVDAAKVHIITGGTSGIGASCAEWLVDQGAKKLILCGRTSLPPEPLWPQYVARQSSDKVTQIIQLIERLRSQGCTVYYYLTPLDDSIQFEHWLEFVLENGQKIGYVLHCAGLTPQSISSNAELNEPLLSSMLVAKLAATRRLIQTLNRFDYDKCILFSSVSSVYPTLASGILEYGLANTALNALAEQDRKGKVIAITWPAWQRYSFNIDQNKHYQRLGLGLFSNEEAFSVLQQVLSQTQTAHVILPSKAKANQIPQVQRGSTTLMQGLKQIFMDVVGLTEDVELSKPFEEYGVDSVLLINLLKRVEALVEKELQPELLLNNNTLEKLYQVLTQQTNYIDTKQTTSLYFEPNMSDKVAIVGMACHFANSPDLDSFWQLLLSGKTAISQIPQHRVDNDDFAYVQGGFIDDRFDHGQQFNFNNWQWSKLHSLVKLSLNLAENALQDAGLSQQVVAGRNIGVYVGCRVPDNNPNATVDNFSMIGRGQNFVAAHINHFYDLKGPSEVVDTACSSSLVALKHALSALKEGDIEMAIVIGCDFLENTKPFAYMKEAGALSPDFQCRPFDARANGIVLSEGGGAVLLKPLAKAQADNDKIYSVVEAVAVNNDGFTMGYTTPNPAIQTQVITMALQKASLTAEAVTYIEMHATGTELGDPMELKALSDALATSNKDHVCYIGSVKANIGHSLSAAGMAGLIKTILCSYHQCLIAQPDELQLAKRYRFDQTPLRLLTQNHLLSPGIHRFGVSAFGFGGTNAHVIISDEFNTPIPNQIQDKSHQAMQTFFAVEAL